MPTINPRGRLLLKTILEFIAENKKSKKEEEAAKHIAASYGLLTEYMMARRYGLSPLEALEEWDLLDINQLNEFSS